MRAMRYRPQKKAVIIDQVSNFEKFGTPVSPHDWSLKDRKKKKRSSNSSGPAIRTCSQCFAVIPANCRVCPICGAEIEVEKQEIQIDKQAKLKKVNGFNPVVVNYIVTKKPSELNSPAEIKAYAKAKGYRPGWIYYQMKSRGWAR
jgi:hypothetical protein